ncbi:hypothetical protein HPB50_021841 [Hyalomma asiaticum]|uniref:Uncharacterized protein n=1 Tax=Hyalomma asiaticum TaxID=266040 RepID=A0ACB7TP10_HYAAI|nr:hypothetical protein HPB50_021841 [Hyalomma asiaticum]
MRRPQPPVDHNCGSKCSLCGDPHLTADNSCAARYKTPYIIHKRIGEGRATIQAIYQQSGSSTLNNRTVSRSRNPAKGSRSRSRTPSRSRQHRSRSRSASASRSKSTNNPQVSFADTLKVTSTSLPLVRMPLRFPPPREPCKKEPRVNTRPRPLWDAHGDIPLPPSWPTLINTPSFGSVPAEDFTRKKLPSINTYANIPAAQTLLYSKKPITPLPHSLVIKHSRPLILVAKALQVAGRHPLLIGGDFNLAHKSWGYVRTEAAARNLWQQDDDLCLTLITDPLDSTPPDLTFIHHIINSVWTNTQQGLSNDHYIFTISLPQLTAAPPPTKDFTATEWDAFRKIRTGATSAEGTSDVNTWTQALRTGVQKATRVVTTDATVERIDRHQARLLEDKASILARWKGQCLNRHLRWKFSKLDTAIEEQCQTVSQQQWTELCNTMDCNCTSQPRGNSSNTYSTILPLALPSRLGCRAPSYGDP